MMIGDPCYQPHRCLEYFKQFNCVHDEERKHLKILLNMPMVPPGEMVDKVNLEYNDESLHQHSIDSLKTSIQTLEEEEGTHNNQMGQPDGRKYQTHRD